MRVKDILWAKGDHVVTMGPEAMIAEALSTLVKQKIGAVVICRGDEVVGVLSERDVVYGLLEQGEGVLGHKVGDLMSGEVHACTPNDGLFKAMSMMTDRRVRHLPIIEDGRLCGIISIGDVVKARIEEIEGEANALREYINT